MAIEFLEHFGIKGMHWGIRNDPKVMIHPNGRTVIAHPSRKDKKWQKNIYSLSGAVAVHNHVADQMNNGILDKLNNKSQYKNHKMIDKFGDPNQDKTSQSYFKEYDKLNWEATQKAVSAVHGASPSGSFKAVLAKNSDKQWEVRIHKVDATHADIPWEDLVMEVDLDLLGHVIKVANIKNSMSQSVNSTAFLEHHGIKGQRWGIRNKVNSKTGRVSGDHRLVSDLRKRPTHTLTNKQLQTVNTRGNLEQSFNRLNPGVIKRGESHIKAVVGLVGTVSSLIAISNTKQGQAAISFIKKHGRKPLHGPGF